MSFSKTLAVTVSVAVIGCAGKGASGGTSSTGPAMNCGTPQCPVGTFHDNSAQSRTGTDIGGNFDPAKFSGGIAFKTFGAGACKYTCVTMVPCAADTVPVITEKCFTCAVRQGDKLVSAQCQPDPAAPSLQPASTSK